MRRSHCWEYILLQRLDGMAENGLKGSEQRTQKLILALREKVGEILRAIEASLPLKSPYLVYWIGPSKRG